jgi:ubiquinone/menaquinone biosynthesis C-methylase UbiE
MIAGMRRAVLAVVAVMLAAMGFVALAWVRERRAKSVFPAGQAASLLHPLREWMQPREATVRAFGLRPGMRALELGPGPGYFTATAARHLGPCGRLVCADLQPAMLRQLRDRLPPDCGHTDLVVADAQRLPFRAGAFDAAFLVAVLGEVPDERRAVAELRRVLARGGAVTFVETLTDPDYVRESRLRELCWQAGLRLDRRQRTLLGYRARFVAG